MSTYWTQFVQIIEKHIVHTEKQDAPAYGHPTYSLQQLRPTRAQQFLGSVPQTRPHTWLN